MCLDCRHGRQYVEQLQLVWSVHCRRQPLYIICTAANLEMYNTYSILAELVMCSCGRHLLRLAICRVEVLCLDWRRGRQYVQQLQLIWSVHCRRQPFYMLCTAASPVVCYMYCRRPAELVTGSYCRHLPSLVICWVEVLCLDCRRGRQYVQQLQLVWSVHCRRQPFVYDMYSC